MSVGPCEGRAGDRKAARPYYERALAVREKVLGPEHPDTATSRGGGGYRA